jgi:hypothetical protein
VQVKLSPNQLALLCIIDKATLWDDGEVKRYWVPYDRTEYYTDPDGVAREFYVFGSGVVASLRSLDARGLTCSPTRAGGGHARQVTDAGRELLQAMRAASRHA